MKTEKSTRKQHGTYSYSCDDFLSSFDSNAAPSKLIVSQLSHSFLTSPHPGTHITVQSLEVVP